MAETQFDQQKLAARWLHYIRGTYVGLTRTVQELVRRYFQFPPVKRMKSAQCMARISTPI
jgi:hypothetical protein